MEKKIFEIDVKKVPEKILFNSKTFQGQHVSKEAPNKFIKRKKELTGMALQVHKRKNNIGSRSQQYKKNRKSGHQHNLKRKKIFSTAGSMKLKKLYLHEKKKVVVSQLQELSQILGAATTPDPKEQELQKIVFGGGASDLEDDNESSSDEMVTPEQSKKQRKPAWEDDDDDESILVKEKADNLKNCHRSIYLRGTEKYSDYVQEKFKKLMGSPQWAELEKKHKTDNTDDESEDELLQKTGNFIQPSKSLPKGIINIRKCPNLEDENLEKAVIKSVEFHPSSRVALMAGTNCTASLFQIDGKINSKIQSVHFERFPIHSAHFTVDGKEIVVGSSMFGHYFAYDMISGKISRIPMEKGMEQRNIRKFHMSPDGKYIAIHGHYGKIHLVTVKTKEWIDTLKMNGEVIAIAFNKDGSKMYSHGDTGEAYVWDMSRRTCIHKFIDEGCMVGTSLTISPNDQFLAAGSDCGVVNIYDNSALFSTSKPKPLKVMMNLTTEISQMKFNCTSELLAVFSTQKRNAVKLVHFPSMTVFSNFPNMQHRLQHVSSLDISVNSGFLCLGNNKAAAQIFRLKHYHNY